MTTQYLVNPVTWKSFTDNSIDSYVGLDREPFIDKRDPDNYRLRLGDGITPGGAEAFIDPLTTIQKPTILSPSNGQVDVRKVPILTADEFNGLNGDLTQAVHGGSYWQIATDASFTNIIFSSDVDTVNLTAIDLLEKGVTLDNDATYYARVLYTSVLSAQSTWSDAVSFTITNAVPNIETALLLASDGETQNQFGRHVDINDAGDLIVIGAHYNDTIAFDGGAVYVYQRTGSGPWIQTQKIYPEDTTTGQQFGYSVAISSSGHTLVVGARYDNTVVIDGGSAYIYNLVSGTYVLDTKISDASVEAEDHFGEGAAISQDGNTIGIGVPGENDPGNGWLGGVHIYVRVDGVWSLEQKIIPDATTYDKAMGIYFVFSADGDTLAAGGRADDNENGQDAGRMYIYTRTASVWTEEANFIGPNPTDYANFGNSCDLSDDGNTLIVGANGDDTYSLLSNGQGDGGSASIYTRSAGIWTLVQTISNSDVIGGDRFGMDVTINGDGTMVAIGAYGSDVPDGQGGTDWQAGNVYIFTLETGVWVETDKFNGSVHVDNDYFGYSTQLNKDGSVLVVGSVFDDQRGINAGAVYVFE